MEKEVPIGKALSLTGSTVGLRRRSSSNIESRLIVSNFTICMLGSLIVHITGDRKAVLFSEFLLCGVYLFGFLMLVNLV